MLTASILMQAGVCAWRGKEVTSGELGDAKDATGARHHPQLEESHSQALKKGLAQLLLFQGTSYRATEAQGSTHVTTA